MVVDSTVVKMGIDWNLVKIADYPTYRGYAAKLASAVIVKYNSNFLFIINSVYFILYTNLLHEVFWVVLRVILLVLKVKSYSIIVIKLSSMKLL